MFRFSCFHSPTHSQKPKKTIHLPAEMMHKTLEDHPTNQPNKNPIISKQIPEREDTNQSPSSITQDWKSEGLKSMNDTNSEDGSHKIAKIRKSVSLGTGLACYQGMTPGDESSSSRNNSESGGQVDKNECQKIASNSVQISSNMVNHESDFSLENQQKSDKDAGENSETHFSGEFSCGSTGRTACTPHSIVKSNSLPFFGSFHTNLVHQSRSYEDLKALGSRRSDDSGEDGARSGKSLPEREREYDNVSHVDKMDGDDGDDGYEYVGSAKDWIVPAVDELGKGKNVQEEYSVSRVEELPNEDFKVKRIEKWVMDLQHCSPLEETITLTKFDHQGQNSNNAVLDPVVDSRIDAKALLGSDAAKRYISSLSVSATTAQLANHGLAVIPFLSAFASLRALNLSGNSIVRITAGVLPRGLHILNLSKNNISTIEGLRELTRLRVLDLSYNRILRIGHGLASCSSLKELYLAGNKISEVEGLHRLLKLNVLDLRFNKLSTTKSLGQLAANYNSLQAISLEGNPAQKNIGDEQLKKFLLGLLPHLAYFNRQLIKSGAMKDSADRAARLGISAHQLDRGLKSTHGRKSQPVARGRHVRLPPSGVKMTSDRHFHDVAVSGKVFGFRPDLAIRRTHSEGLLRAV